MFEVHSMSQQPGTMVSFGKPDFVEEFPSLRDALEDIAKNWRITYQYSVLDIREVGSDGTKIVLTHSQIHDKMDKLMRMQAAFPHAAQ